MGGKKTAPRALSPKQQRFVDEYLVDFNATKAAERAGYSAKSAYAQASALLRKPEIFAAVEAGRQRLAEKTGTTAERVRAELAILAFSDIRDVIQTGDEGEVYVKRLDSLPPEVTRAISEITQVTTETKTVGRGKAKKSVERVRLGVRYHSKVKALELLADHFGMRAPQKHEVTGKEGGPIETATRVRYVVKVPKEEPEE